MELYQNIILSITQGITELLPISSSGHLLLVSRYLFNFELTQSTLASLHLGTTLAILLYYSKDLIKLLTKNGVSFITKLVLASIPAAIVGLLFGDFIEEALYSTSVVAGSLILWGIVMVFAERKSPQTSDLSEISLKQSLIMGFAQTLALIPGTSRSGVTTVAGIFSGVEKYTALSFSFILGLPVLFGASTLYIYKSGGLSIDLVSLGVTFIVGLLSLFVLERIAKKNFLTIFGIYRILLGLLILL